MNEFHDGILLFEISGRKVWNKVQEDSTGLRRYYDEHKQNYLTRKGIEAKVYTLKLLKGEKMLKSAYKKYSRKAEADKLMLSKFNKKGDSLLVINEGKWLKGDDPEMDKLSWTKGPQSAIINGFPSLVVINNVLEPVPLPFEEVQGEMMTGYQEFLENEWIKQLKEKYTVKIDDLVFNEVKKSLNNE
jgi:peptidyl-prolyl cis-trans isomerase SurA